MKRYYSKSTQTTYVSGIHAAMPDDAVEITDQRYVEVIVNPAAGKLRSHDEYGLPILIDPPQPSASEFAQSTYARQISAINSACESAITAGFPSSALGTLHHYASQFDDQLNLTGVILRGFDTLYACRDEQGLKEYRPHTFAQVRQVGDDFTLYKLQLLQKALQLKQLLDLALEQGDVDALEAVTWEPAQS